MNRYESYKEVDLPWLQEIPSHWEVDRAKNHFTYEKLLNKNNIEKNILSLTLKGVIKNNVDKPIGLSPSDYSTYQLFKKGDLVFKLIDLNNVKTSRVGLVFEDGAMSSAYIRLFKKNGNYFEKYFYYWYFKLYIEEVFNKLGSGVRETIGKDDLLALEVPIPTLQEQTQIANYLDWKINEIDRLIAKEKEKIRELEIGFKNFISNKLNIFNENHHIFIKLKFLTDVITCKSEEKKIYIALENISSLKGRLNCSLEDLPESAEGISLKKGMVIFGKLRPYLGKVLKIENNAVCSPEFIVFDPKLLTSDYLKYVLLTDDFVSVVDSSTYGTKMPRASSTFIKNLKIGVPDLDEQQKTVNEIEFMNSKIENLINKTNKQIKNLESLKQSLISEVVTGQIDVRDVVIPEYEKIVLEIEDELEEEVEEDE